MTPRRSTITFEELPPTNNEQTAFECAGLAAANAKAAELRMGRYREVVMSLVKPSEADAPTT